MKRREFLRGAAALSLLGVNARAFAQASPPLAAPSASPSPPPPVTPEFRPLRRGIGYFTARGGTIGWLVNDGGCVAVDAQFPDTAKLFLDGLPGRNGRKLDLLINTHHHADHTAGNLILGPEAKEIAAHRNVPGLQRAAAEVAKTLEQQVFAATLFDAEWKRDLPGGETLRAFHHGPAHTGGDAVFHFEQADVVHVGDLVFNKIYPAIDRRGGASIANWTVVLEKLAAQFKGADTLFIFGHGRKEAGVTGSAKDLLVMRDYLNGLREFVQRAVAAGKPLDELIKTTDKLPGFEAYDDPKPNRLPQNLTVAFEELTAEVKR